MSQMGKRTHKVILATVPSYVIIIMMQGSLFDNTNIIGQGLNFVAAISDMQSNGDTIAGNNLEQPSSPVTQQTFSDPVHNSFRNVALPSTIQTTNLTAVFKQVENSG
jgi:hypothetical protein